MKPMQAISALALLAGVAGGVRAQDVPQDIPKNELPQKAVCAVCELQGSAHGEERPAAGVRYKGKAYYFCNGKEAAAFKQAPEDYMPPVLPRPAPKFTLKTLEEKETTLNDYKGKILLVDFWATWCKPCVETMPEMQKLQEKYAAKGLVVLGVSIDEKGVKAVRPFVQKRKFTYPILLDGGDRPAWREFGVKSVPALFLVSREGQIVRQWTGKPKKGDVEEAVQSALK
ncbi:MAG TPA: redoxin domain-containing protein [Chthonomonadaceae bacterium]|nr:redoxin domain-containing protein [Chthonomonadaceae bacterium]